MFSALSFARHVVLFGMSGVLDGMLTKSMPVRGGERGTTKRFSSGHLHASAASVPWTWDIIWTCFGVASFASKFLRLCVPEKSLDLTWKLCGNYPLVSGTCILLALHVAFS